MVRCFSFNDFTIYNWHKVYGHISFYIFLNIHNQ